MIVLNNSFAFYLFLYITNLTFQIYNNILKQIVQYLDNRDRDVDNRDQYQDCTVSRF